MMSSFVWSLRKSADQRSTFSLSGFDMSSIIIDVLVFMASCNEIRAGLATAAVGPVIGAVVSLLSGETRKRIRIMYCIHVHVVMLHINIIEY